MMNIVPAPVKKLFFLADDMETFIFGRSLMFWSFFINRFDNLVHIVMPMNNYT